MKKRNLSLLSPLLFVIVLPFIITLPTMAQSITDEMLQFYFPENDSLESIIENWLGNISPKSADEALAFTEDVLKKYPGYLTVHLLRGHVLYHGKGRVKEAYEEYTLVNRAIKKIQESDVDYSPYAAAMEDMNAQIEFFAIPSIERDFAPLRFKIKNKVISKFCHIQNMEVIITVDEIVYNYANADQRLRLEYLNDYLASGQMRFQFSSYDSLDNRYYFEIPFFPLIDVPGSQEPYAIILNNKKRYHFRINRQYNETVEIDWNDNWELVESVPDDLVKFEYPNDYTMVPFIGVIGREVPGTIQIPEPEADVNSLYIPVTETAELQILFEPPPSRQAIEKGLFYFVRGTIILAIIATFLIVR